MVGDEGAQWYTNKELFERLVDLKDDFSDLRLEMKETRALIKSYNGLREEIEKMREENNEIKQQVQTINAKASGSSHTLDSLRNWGGWAFAFITLLVLMYNQIN